MFVGSIVPTTIRPLSDHPLMSSSTHKMNMPQSY